MYKIFCNICGKEIDGCAKIELPDFWEIHLCAEHMKELDQWFADKKSKYPPVKK